MSHADGGQPARDGLDAAFRKLAVLDQTSAKTRSHELEQHVVHRDVEMLLGIAQRAEWDGGKGERPLVTESAVEGETRNPRRHQIGRRIERAAKAVEHAAEALDQRAL